MFVGFLINSSMIVVSAQVFYKFGIVVTELEQAQATLKPILGNAASLILLLP